MPTILHRAGLQRHCLAHALVLLAVALHLIAATPIRAEDRTDGAALPEHAAQNTSPTSEIISEDCFDELENGATPLLACRVPLILSESEQAELEKGSRGYVKNVNCMLTIKIERKELEVPTSEPNHVFQSPEQPVTCTVTTYKSTFDITATFAPRITFKDGDAVGALPGLGNVQGVSRVISWPVVQFVNRWKSIQNGMLQVVNAYLARERKRVPDKK